MILERRDYVGVLCTLVAQLSNELAVEKKLTRRVNLDDLEDDGDEEVCHTLMLLLRVLCLISFSTLSPG